MKITKFPKAVERKAYLAKKGITKQLNFKNIHEEVVETWSPGIFKNDERTGDNFVEAHVVALDFDENITVEEVKKRLESLNLECYLSYSHNHRKEKNGRVEDRFRLIFPLDKAIKSKKQYENTIKKAMNLFPECDDKCSDSARFFFSSENGEYFDGRPFPTSENKEHKQSDVCAIGKDALEFFANAASGLPGNWNDSLNKAAFCLAMGGMNVNLAKDMLEAFSPNPFDKKDLKTFESGWNSGNRQFQSNGTSTLLQKIGAKGKKPDSEAVFLMLNDEIKDKFLVLEDESGRRAVILQDVGDKLVRKTNTDVIKSIVAKLIYKEYNYFCTSNEAENHVENWVTYTEPLNEEPRSMAFNGEDIYAYHKVSFDPEEMDTPVWDEFISRCTNADALQAYIWSIFNNESDRQQYLWLYGDGMNGKSSLAEIMSRCLGDSYMSKSAVNSYNNKNFTSTLVGKRLAVFSDCNSTGFVKSEQFKELTGGDKIEIEFKYEPAYSTYLDVKFMFFSNFLPQLSSKKADVRRIILCEVAPITGDPDPFYIDKLWGEIKGILYKCRKKYFDLVDGNGLIPCDISDVVDVGNDSEIAFESIYHEFFLPGSKDDFLTGRDVYDTIMGSLRRHGVKLVLFKDWLRRVKGVEVNSRNETREQRYIGIKLKGGIK